MTGAILGPPSANRQTVLANLGAMGATELFTATMFPLLWDIAVEYGIDSNGMIAQSFKETKGGAFTGNVQAWFYNSAGLKVRHDGHVMAMLGTSDSNHPLVHQMFPNWATGITAHAQRLLDYCLVDLPENPPGTLIVDPRHGFGNRGITTWSELGGRWAPSPTYGDEIWALAERLTLTS